MKKISDSSKIANKFFEKIEKLTDAQKIIICVSTFILIVGGFFYFSYMPKYKEIKTYKAQYKKLASDLVVAKKNAKELNKYRALLEEKKAEFNIVRRALPEKKEIPSLISGVSRAGLDAGLDFILFKPNAEIKKEFYAEIPISIKVNGGFHNLAVFFDKTSRLPRIVNVDNIIVALGKADGKTALKISCKAITYKFIDKPNATGTNKKKKKA